MRVDVLVRARDRAPVPAEEAPGPAAGRGAAGPLPLLGARQRRQRDPANRDFAYVGKGVRVSKIGKFCKNVQKF